MTRSNPLRQKALAQAFRYLSRRDHSIPEMRAKLERKKYPPEIIEDVVAELCDYEFLNDENFARSVVRHSQEYKRLGTAGVKAELAKKGITGEIAQDAIKDEYSCETELENIEAIISRRAEKGEEKDKILRALLRKGYSWSVIGQVIKEKFPMLGKTAQDE